MAPSESMPRWNLERHFAYASAFDGKIDEDIEKVEKEAEKFQLEYKCKLDELLPQAIVKYEQLCEILGTIEAYLFLCWSVKQTDDPLTTRQSCVKAKTNQIRSDSLVFFTLEISKIDQKVLQALLDKNETLRHYESWLQDTRANRPYYLDEKVERALNVRSPWASEEVVAEYLEQKLSAAKFNFNDSSVSLEEILNKLFDSSQSTRSLALKSLNQGLEGSHVTEFAALSLNMVAGRWVIEMKERGYKTLRSSRNISNKVPDTVVDALLKAVRSVGVDLAKRYYRLKKAILKSTAKIEKFRWADRNAPLCLEEGERTYSWTEAVEMVHSGYTRFSPKMAAMFNKMISEERIDVPAVQGKRSGAFCHGVAPAIGPFQLNNFIGNKRDVTTLAHESGHGCHDYLAYKQGYLQYHPPLTLAETASIFGEMVVFRDLLGKCEDKGSRLSTLMVKIDDLINSVVRQCSFDRFEELVHSARQNGVLADDMFAKFWMQATKEFYGEEGEVFDQYEDMSNLWAYVSHFHAVPFYVYSYAFADLLVGALYNVYTKCKDGFEEKLLTLLEAGGTGHFIELLAPFGLNPAEDTFWKDAINTHLGSLLDEAESLAKELKLA